MTVTVCIPWREAPDRLRAHDRVRTFWQQHGYTVIEADSDPDQPFHLAEARNNAVRQAEDGIVIVADADTIPEPLKVKSAVEIAKDPDAGVVYPFDEYRYLPPSALNMRDQSLRIVRPLWVKRNSVGGVFVTSTETYWDIGGQDERLSRTWGFEDDCFLAAAETLAYVGRIPGNVYAFSHDVEGGRDWSEANPNHAHFLRYEAARGNPEAMRALIAR